MCKQWQQIKRENPLFEVKHRFSARWREESSSCVVGKELLSLVLKILDLFSAITPVRQSKKSQGYDKWALGPHMEWRLPAHAPPPPPRSPQVRPCIENPLRSLTVCRRTHCIVLLPRIGLNNVSDSFGHVSVLASVQRTGHPRHWPFKKSKSPKYPWLTNHPSLPARVATQTAQPGIVTSSASPHDIRPLMHYTWSHQQYRFVFVIFILDTAFKSLCF